MPKLIIIDQGACTGCRQCELVCSVKHTGTADPARARITTIKWEAEGFYLPMLCQQCLEPACAAVCPKKALSRDTATDRDDIDRALEDVIRSNLMPSLEGLEKNELRCIMLKAYEVLGEESAITQTLQNMVDSPGMSIFG